MQGGVENDQRVMSILSEARRLQPGERDEFVRAACGCDSDLYSELVEALQWEERMGNFLLDPLLNLIEAVGPFQDGEVVSERFEIVREIGEGGMGIVYEAFDRKRGHRIAIKAAKTGFQRLLSPELEGALKVRHRNICLVNEIHTAQTKRGAVDFLTMEFLEGETLSGRLFEKGRLPEKQAREVARQVCAGLAEAHRSGVIHRDLKSANIILCAEKDGSCRAVITDFGLAASQGLPSEEIGGTPGYMAPEVMKGEKATSASDIYSLGVILYEIVTGEKPMEEKSAEPDRPSHFAAPSSLNKGLDPTWDGVVLSCLESSPALRPSDASQVIAGLEKKPLRKAPLLAVAVLILAMLATPQVRESLTDRFWPPPNVRLAVLPLEGATKSADIGGGILQDVSDRIRRMSSGKRTVVVIPPSEILDRQIQTPEQARDVLHATHALVTTVKNEGDESVVEGTVVDLDTQTHLREFSARYSPATIGTVPTALAGAVSVALRLHGPTSPDVLSSAATPAYDRGLYLLRRDRESFEEAIASFEQAARLDPRSSVPLAGLVEAKILKFEETQQESSLEDARRALHAAESLNPDSPNVRLAAGLLKETTSQYEQALEDYRRVQELQPRNVEAFRRIAGVYDKLGMRSEAIAAYQKAIELDPGYYGEYHALGVFYYYHGNYEEAAEQFNKSIERAPGLFDEYTNLGAALDELGRDTEAEKALLTSLHLRETPRALNSMGAMRAYQKKDEEAVAYYERAVALDPSEYVYQENLADSYRRLGRKRDANAAYRKALDLALAALNENPRLGYDRGFVAYISARLGDRKRAEDEIAQALQLSPGETKVIRNAVLTYEVLGERDRAIQVLGGAPPELLHELDRQPDLADFIQDSRFKQLVAKNSN